MRRSSGSSRYCVPGCKASGTLKVRPSSPPVTPESCDAETRGTRTPTASVIIAKKIAFTRRLNRADQERQQQRYAERRRRARARRPPQVGGARCVCSRSRCRTPPMPKKHRCAPKTDDAGVAKQQVETRDQHDEDDEPSRADVERLSCPGNRNGRGTRGCGRRFAMSSSGEPSGCAASRETKDVAASRLHRFATGYSPCGRHSSTSTISPMLENITTGGARKARVVDDQPRTSSATR